MTQRKQGTSRRKFLKGSAAAVAAPYFITSTALGGGGRAPASERIVLGAIGLGSRGRGDLGAFLLRGDVQVAAVRDGVTGARGGQKLKGDLHRAHNG